MSSALLHIGLAKTGTSSIQSLLHKNADQVENAGYMYPRFLDRMNHVQLAAYAAPSSQSGTLRLVGVTSPEEHEEYRKRFLLMFREKTRDGEWIFSSEHLASRVIGVDAMDRLSDLVSHFDRVRILMYVRRQDLMAVAAHSTWLRDGRTAPFDINEHLSNANRYDFDLIARRWEEVFGRGSVEVRLYPPKGVLQDFAETVGLGLLQDWKLPKVLNRSLTSVEAEFVREMNERLPRSDTGPGSDYEDFSGKVEGSGRGERLRMSSADARKILELFANSNQRTMKRATNADSFPGYFNSSTGNLDSNLETDLTVEDTLEFARRLWATGSKWRRRARDL